MGQLLDNIIKKYTTKDTRKIELIFVKHKKDIDEARARGYKKDDIIRELCRLEKIGIDLNNFNYYTRKIEKNKNNTTATSNLELKEVENKKSDCNKELIGNNEPIKIVPRGANSIVYKFQFKQNGSEYYPVTTRTQAFSNKKDVENWIKKKEKSKSKEMGYPVKYELISCEAIG